MKSNAIISSLLALSLTVAGSAFGQGDGDLQAQQRNMRQLQRRANPQQIQRGHEAQRQRGFDQQRQRGFDRQQAQRGGQFRDERGAGPDHRFHRGDRLPPQYRSRNYVVEDWRGHHLSAPPRGYHWVQMGSDYVLVAIATGIILQLILNN